MEEKQLLKKLFFAAFVAAFLALLFFFSNSSLQFAGQSKNFLAQKFPG